MGKRSLAGKRALVTGASSGIGEALAIQLADAGARLLLTARRQDRLDDLADRIREAGGEVAVLSGDLTSDSHRIALVDWVDSSWGALDILVNNAGTTAFGPFADAQPERLRRIFEVNFFALAELTRLAIPRLAAGSEPLIVNVSSVLAHRAVPLKVEYCASKFAVHGFSDALRAELQPAGIEVLLVSPSTTDSELFDTALEDRTGIDWKRRGAMPPATVARHAIRAMERHRQEVILSAGGRFLVWLDRMFPGVANRVTARYGQQG